jgi:hypothetical protein
MGQEQLWITAGATGFEVARSWQVSLDQRRENPGSASKLARVTL